MTDLPAGWARASIDEIADVQGGIQKQPKRQPRQNTAPFLRVANVHRGRLDLSEVHAIELFDGEFERYRLRHGDLLVVEGNGSPTQIGRAAMWQDEITGCVHQNHLIRVRPSEAILPKYLALAWNSSDISDQLRRVASSTSGLYTLSTAKIKAITVTLPPLEEQLRIVTELDDYLSRFEAGLDLTHHSQLRLRSLVKRLLIEAVPIPGPAHWGIVPVGEAGLVDLGRQRHPDWHTGPHMRPYLRVANVFEDRIDLSDVMEMNLPPDVFERYRLTAGDILLNEGQSPELLGRPAMYRGHPAEIAFTNSLLRFRARSDVDPEWALLVFRRHMHAGRFTREVRITTNIAHLSASRFKTVEFPIPPLAEQTRIVEAVKAKLTGIGHIERLLHAAQRRARKLRQALLDKAVRGRLVPQDPHDELASVLLERIRRERAAQPQVPRRRRQSAAEQEEALL